MNKTAIVIPTYNEAENLPILINALQGLDIGNLQILVVDDNSPDGTGDIAEGLKAIDPNSRPTPGSGCGNSIGDVSNKFFFVECKQKHTKENIIIDFKEEWLSLTSRMSLQSKKIPVIVTENKYGDRFVTMSAEDFFNEVNLRKSLSVNLIQCRALVICWICSSAVVTDSSLSTSEDVLPSSVSRFPIESRFLNIGKVRFGMVSPPVFNRYI